MRFPSDLITLTLTSSSKSSIVSIRKGIAFILPDAPSASAAFFLIVQSLSSSARIIDLISLSIPSNCDPILTFILLECNSNSSFIYLPNLSNKMFGDPSFFKYLFAPRLIASFSVSSIPFPVKRMNGILISISRIFFKNSIPSIPGIL